MRNKKVALTLISVLTAIIMILTLSATIFAAEEESAFEEPVVVETQAQQADPVETQAPVEEPDYDFGDDEEEDSDSGYVEPEPQPDDSDEDSGYVEPTEAPTQAPTYYEVYSDELPEIESQMIILPTSIVPPDIEVSDTSLLGGVIAWLCVAVGIAVIAGVLVSQRTRQNTGRR